MKADADMSSRFMFNTFERMRWIHARKVDETIV